MTVTYRTPEPDDIEALAALGRDTFVDTFAHLYSETDLHQFLKEVYSPAAIRADMEDPAKAYMIAETDSGRMIGYCKIYDGQSLEYDAGKAKIMELKQLYILKSHHGKSVADQLMQWAENKAQSFSADVILLSVFSENYRAQAFYKKYGFIHVGDTIFMVGDHEDHEFLYLKQLIK